MGGSTKWKVPIDICFTLPGTFGAIKDHMRVYSSALYGPCARLHNDVFAPGKNWQRPASLLKI
jgi:hypothetical protein